MLMDEKQITFTPKNHSLDNNDNFSPDDNFLCYDTRGTERAGDLANCKSIEKVEIATGEETVLWKPESVNGPGIQAAPGVAAVSYHPTENKVIFIHGPFVDEVEERGFYGLKNRTGIEVSADDSHKMIKVDMRDVAFDKQTTAGAHRGGTHRHEYSRTGKRIGFTYDDFLVQDYDRTIGYMEENAQAPAGYTHYFALLVKPAKKGEAKPGEIEKAWGDSWVGSEGNHRAFIAKIRAENGVDYVHDLCVVDIAENVDITSAKPGSLTSYPSPPLDLKIRRLTHIGSVNGIVRGTVDGKQIAYLAQDESGIEQVFVIPTDGSDISEEQNKQPRQVTNLKESTSSVRWHPSGNWIFCISGGDIVAIFVGDGINFGKSFRLTDDEKMRNNLVLSNNGKILAYNIRISTKDKENNPVRDIENNDFMQVFVMHPKMDELLRL